MRDGDGPYTWITFSEAATSIKEFKAGLLELGLPGLYIQSLQPLNVFESSSFSVRPLKQLGSGQYLILV